MDRGMRRNVIMSHGGVHDAKGLKGTYRKGTTPPAKVLDAIPNAANAVGPMAPNAMPGAAASTAARKPVPMTLDAEGDLVMPGGNRSGGPSTMRPSIDDEPAVITRSSSGQVPAEAVVIEEVEEFVEVSDDTTDDEDSPSITKRQLTRAGSAELTAWCASLEIDPSAHIGEAQTVTNKLMRQLIGDAIGIEV